MTSFMESLLQESAFFYHENSGQQETLVDDNHSINNVATVDTSRAFCYVRTGVFLSLSPKSQTVNTKFKNQEKQPSKLTIFIFITSAQTSIKIELEETKRELNLLTQRESETEIALDIKSEAVSAGEKASVASKKSSQIYIGEGGDHKNLVSSHEDDIHKEIMKMERYSTSLVEVLSLGEKEGYFDHFQDKKTLKKNKMTNIKKRKNLLFPLLEICFKGK
ncbi:hypothetical protein MKX01_018608 [Papaver californicum]|nr:hypothetical protein MKX01_018608 [Papaver californicum]